jgi:RNA polymerase sigma factor (TIGR02999 family)
MKRERSNHTLQTTAVMNEAVMRLLGAEGTEWNDRQHFLAVASRVMRRFLVDYARAGKTQKRDAIVVSLDSAQSAGAGKVSTQVLDVHLALEEFVQIAPRQAQLVELRFFGGLTLDEAAKVLEISPRLADKDWALARAWLRQRLEPGDAVSE